MRTAIDYAADANFHMQHALGRMPVIAAAGARSLPASGQEISRYAEQFLTLEEQQICDMATD